MLLTEYDEKKRRKLDREEGREEGREVLESINKLHVLLIEQGRTDDIIKAAKDKEYQKKLLREFHLEFEHDSSWW